MIRAFEWAYFMLFTTALYVTWRALIGHQPLWYELLAAGLVCGAVGYRFTKITP